MDPTEIRSRALIDLLDQFEVPENRGDLRLALSDAILRFQARLQTPIEHIRVLCNANQSIHSVLHTTIDMGLWQAWADDGRKEQTLEDLVKLVPGGCDADLLRRLLRLLAAWYIVDETGEDIYQRGPLTEALGDPLSGPSGFVKWCKHSHPPTHALPSFLASNSYRNAGTLSHNSYTSTHPDGLDMFAHTREDPDGFGKDFAEFMRSLTRTKIPWTDVFDTSSLLSGAVLGDEDTPPLLVDVAGGMGSDVKHFLVRWADAKLPKGSVALQDQPSVLASPKMDPFNAGLQVRTMPYDFFSPQPIAGARAYFFHAVLHDWPDEDALRILKNTSGAMKKGYSKLLLYEVCLSPKGATVVQAGMDIRMMVMLGGRERTEAVWKGMLSDAGLKLVKVWRAEGGFESVLEAELE